ncbi:helix-turn-helix domain-containing protein [Paenalcaligenes niemegkensis]|uniref:helix-turn-helix domain-containing protein n=1 Tax=Paenalcaligenes niemegkensis TaxID=2895469 RepID=UPI001EE83F14|nr:helix-turn-helix domain-containing protein [Paenalcaligenes niemegkensis]MCQ9615391.1 helix-turn-helix domain-containing protein [Paenalcaligenes niemegkensis]
MYKLDITLMVLSQPASPASIKLMRLFYYFSGIGLNCRISTSPSELFSSRPFRRKHVVIVDGTDPSVYDVYTIASSLRTDHLSFVVLLLNDDEYSTESSGSFLDVDLCLSIRIHQLLIAEKIVAAMCGEYQQYELPSADIQHGQPALLPELPSNPILDISQERKVTSQVSPALKQQKHEAWSLKNQGWELVAPTGRVIVLARAERKLMHGFITSPWGLVTFQDFDGWQSELHKPYSESLAGVVANLRRKFRTSGTSVPIYSRRGVGYFFKGIWATAQPNLSTGINTRRQPSDFSASSDRAMTKTYSFDIQTRSGE